MLWEKCEEGCAEAGKPIGTPEAPADPRVLGRTDEEAVAERDERVAERRHAVPQAGHPEPRGLRGDGEDGPARGLQEPGPDDRDLDEHTAHIQHYVDLGFDEIHLHNVGRNQPSSSRSRQGGPAVGRDVGARRDRATARGGPAAASRGRTCGPCRRSGPAWSGRPSPASASARRRRRSGRPGAGRPVVTPVAAKTRFSPGARSSVAVDAVLVAVAHPRAARALVVVAVAEARLDLAAEAAQRGRRDHALRRAADAHDGVDAGARDGAARSPPTGRRR